MWASTKPSPDTQLSAVSAMQRNSNAERREIHRSQKPRDDAEESHASVGMTNSRFAVISKQLALSMDKVQPTRDELRENIGVHHDDDADDGRKGHGMPENEAEN